MNLTKKALFSYLEVLKTTFLNQYLRKIVYHSKRYIFFSFASNKECLLAFNLDNEKPALYRSNLIDLPTSLQTHFGVSLRKNLTNAKLIKIEQINDDLVVCLTFLVTNQTFEKEEKKLYLELIKAKPNLVLVSAQEKIIDALNTTSWQSQRFIAPTNKYVLPLKNPLLKDEDTLIDFALYEEEQNALFLEQKTLRGKEKYLHVFHYLKTKINKVKRKIKNIEDDALKAKENLIYEVYANELLTHYAHLKKGLKEIVVDGQTIALNEQLTPVQNAQNFFKIVRKSKKALSLSENLKNEALKELDYYLEVQDFINFSNEERVDAFLEKNNFLGQKKKLPPLQFKKEDPYRVTKNETPFYYGKNAFQNDFLTFSLAKKDHTWLHIKQTPSAHLVIFKVKPSLDDLLTAAELLLLISDLEKGEVIYSLRQNLARGDKPGLVYVSKYETIFVALIRDETRLLLKKAKRIGLK